nr:DUF4116 domain-containing protein [Salinisphaera sp. G21_0]
MVIREIKAKDSIQPTRSGPAVAQTALGLIEDKVGQLPGRPASSAFTRSVTPENSCKRLRIDGDNSTDRSFPTLSAHGIELSDTKNSRPASHDLPPAISTLITDSKNRSSIGGKGLFLHLMQQANIPVPPFTVVDTELIARLEQEPFPAKCLLSFLPGINKRGLESCSLEQLRAIITELPAQQQSEWLKGLSGFIASEDFYQQVKDSSVAREIRDRYLTLRQPSNGACIVRSSGVDEDRFGNAQAGRFDSLVHGGGDILTTCLQVLSSAYRPEVCPGGEVKPMALVLQQCIRCHLGGVVFSHSTLKDDDDTIQVEFAPGQPRGAVSGNTGIRPHRYRIRRGDDENSKPDREFTPGDVTTQFALKKINGEEGYAEQSITTTTDAKDIRLTDEILQKLQEYTVQLENIFYCPVDIEFGVDVWGNFFVFQCRPVTQLPGSTRFCAAAPSLPLAEGIMVSEGYRSGVALEVTEPVSAEQFPFGAILFAVHASDWMLAPEILQRLGGCVFSQGGTTDHVAITLCQAGIPCLVAGSQYSEALTQASGQQVTLVVGSFSGSPGAYLQTGDQSAYWEANSTSSGQDTISSPATSAAEPPNFTRVDEGFAWLNRQNNRLLDYFHPDRILSRCLGPGRSKAVSMSAKRSDLLQQLGMEIQLLQEDLQLFASGYKHFLGLAKTSESDATPFEVQSFINDLPLLKKQRTGLKNAIDNLYSKVVTPLTTDRELTTESGDFRQWLKDCQTLRDKLQKLTQPKKMKAIHSVHDLIYWLHQRFVRALAPVAEASGMGKINKIAFIDEDIFDETDQNMVLIEILPQGVSGLLNHHCISVLRKLGVKTLRILNMVDAAFVNAKIGVHVCTITMLEQAEGGKGRTLRLDISDNFSQHPENIHLQGKLKRFWFLVQTLRCASIDRKSRPMAISFNQNAGKMTIECTQVDSPSELQTAFVKLVTVLSGLTSMDITINKFNRGKNTNKWYFETLAKKCQKGLSDSIDNWVFKHCLILDAIEGRHLMLKSRYYDCEFLDYLDDQYWHLFEVAKKVHHPLEYLESTESKNEKAILRQILSAATKHLEPNDAARIIKELLAHMAIEKNFPEIVIRLLREDFDLDHDRELVLFLVQQNVDIFKYISNDFKDDIDIAKSAIRQYASFLKYASDRLRNDKSLVMFAIKIDGYSLAYASTDLKNDPVVVMEATRTNYFAYYHAGKTVKNNETLLRKIIEVNPEVMQFATKSLKNDKDFVLPLLSREPSIYEYLSDRLRSDPDIQVAAGRKDVGAETASSQRSNQPENEKPTNQGCSCVIL